MNGQVLSDFAGFGEITNVNVDGNRAYIQYLYFSGSTKPYSLATYTISEVEDGDHLWLDCRLFEVEDINTNTQTLTIRRPDNAPIGNLFVSGQTFGICRAGPTGYSMFKYADGNGSVVEGASVGVGICALSHYGLTYSGSGGGIADLEAGDGIDITGTSTQLISLINGPSNSVLKRNSQNDVYWDLNINTTPTNPNDVFVNSNIAVETTNPTTTTVGKIGDAWYNRISKEMFILSEITTSNTTSPAILKGGFTRVFQSLRITNPAIARVTSVRVFGQGIPKTTENFADISITAVNQTNPTAAFTGLVVNPTVIGANPTIPLYQSYTYNTTTGSITGTPSFIPVSLNDDLLFSLHSYVGFEFDYRTDNPFADGEYLSSQSFNGTTFSPNADYDMCLEIGIEDVNENALAPINTCAVSGASTKTYVWRRVEDGNSTWLRADNNSVEEPLNSTNTNLAAFRTGKIGIGNFVNSTVDADVHIKPATGLSPRVYLQPTGVSEAASVMSYEGGVTSTPMFQIGKTSNTSSDIVFKNLTDGDTKIVNGQFSSAVFSKDGFVWLPYIREFDLSQVPGNGSDYVMVRTATGEIGYRTVSESWYSGGGDYWVQSSQNPPATCTQYTGSIWQNTATDRAYALKSKERTTISGTPATNEEEATNAFPGTSPSFTGLVSSLTQMRGQSITVPAGGSFIADSVKVSLLYFTTETNVRAVIRDIATGNILASSPYIAGPRSTQVGYQTFTFYFSTHTPIPAGSYIIGIQSEVSAYRMSFSTVGDYAGGQRYQGTSPAGLANEDFNFQFGYYYIPTGTVVGNNCTWQSHPSDNINDYDFSNLKVVTGATSDAANTAAATAPEVPVGKLFIWDTGNSRVILMRK